jgi:hypothetical protein
MNLVAITLPPRNTPSLLLCPRRTRTQRRILEETRMQEQPEITGTRGGGLSSGRVSRWLIAQVRGNSSGAGMFSRTVWFVSATFSRCSNRQVLFLLRQEMCLLPNDDTLYRIVNNTHIGGELGLQPLSSLRLFSQCSCSCEGRGSRGS